MSTAVVPDWVAERFPVTHRFLEVDGHTVHYVDEGAGPPLLLLHGNPTWSYLYRGIIERLRSSFRCIAPDYPGFGLSRAAPGSGFLPAEHADVVQRLVAELDLDGLTLMVQDWGGPIGLGAAAREPWRYRGLVVGNSWAWPVNGDRHFEPFSRILGGRLGRLAIRQFNGFVNGVQLPARLVARGGLPVDLDSYRRVAPTADAREPHAVLPREVLGSRAFLADVEAGLHRLAHLPALIVWGGRDVAFRDIERRRFEGHFPRHRVVPLPRAGHYLQEDASDEIATAIRQWWPTT